MRGFCWYKGPLGFGYALRGGGCTRISGLGVPQLLSAISIIPLWLSPVNRPLHASDAGIKERGRERPPPQKSGGACDLG